MQLLLCVPCSKQARPKKKNRGMTMYCTGTIRTEHPPNPQDKPLLECQNCHLPLKLGDHACCFQYWSSGEDIDHGWEHDYLSGELVYDWRAF